MPEAISAAVDLLQAGYLAGLARFNAQMSLARFDPPALTAGMAFLWLLVTWLLWHSAGRRPRKGGLRRLARAWCERYADQAGLTYRPLLVFEASEAQKIGLTEFPPDDEVKGFAFPDLGLIRLVLENHRNRDDVLDTVAHEVVHCRWPGLRHGRAFERRVRVILAGYWYEPG